MTGPLIASAPLAAGSEPSGAGAGSRRPRPRRPGPVRALWRATLWLAVLVTAYLGVTFVQVWMAAGRHDGGPVDAVVVLGAAQYDGVPSPVFQARLDHAAELYRDGAAPTVVVTGGGQPEDRFTEGTVGYRYLRDQGIPDEDLVVIVDGSNTWESLAAARRPLAEAGLESVLLVSDPYHNLRLLGTADDLGLDAHVDATDSGSSFGRLLRETGAVAVGRIIGYRRLLRFAS